MKPHSNRRFIRDLARVAAAIVLTAFTVGCGHLMGMLEPQPAESEFGWGPRASQHQLYTATLQPTQPLKARRLLTVPVRITDAGGRPVDDAVILVDGGMPQHGHGLPTQPRVARALGNGVYEIEGLRFNMGGWWELELAIQTAAGTDNVTFNLTL